MHRHFKRDKYMNMLQKIAVKVLKERTDIVSKRQMVKTLYKFAVFNHWWGCLKLMIAVFKQHGGVSKWGRHLKGYKGTKDGYMGLFCGSPCDCCQLRKEVHFVFFTL